MFNLPFNTAFIIAATTCLDDISFDCARMDSMFAICNDVQQAKLVCPRYCKLCDMGMFIFVIYNMHVVYMASPVTTSNLKYMDCSHVLIRRLGAVQM